MNRFILCFLIASLFAFSILGQAQATPLTFTENESSLTSDNIWTRGERYSFWGHSISLSKGLYNLNFNINGFVWQEGQKSHGWKTDDQIIIEAYLNDSLIGSTTKYGLDGQNKTFNISLLLDFDLDEDGILEINVYSKVSSRQKYWRIESAILMGGFSESINAENPVIPIPKPATLLFLGCGWLGFSGLLKKFRK
jgi:hypothetical protein